MAHAGGRSDAAHRMVHLGVADVTEPYEVGKFSCQARKPGGGESITFGCMTRANANGVAPRMRWAVLGVALMLTACSGSNARLSGESASTPSTAQLTSAASPASTGAAGALRLETFPVPAGGRPHDVAPAADGGVWFTAQGAGYLGHLDPATGRVSQVPLRSGSAPHGVIVGPDGAAWVTDGGLNAIVCVDATTRAVQTFPFARQPSQRESQHRHLRPVRRVVVHRTGRGLRPPGSGDR